MSVTPRYVDAPQRRGVTSRIRLLGWAFVLMITRPLAAVLFSLWITSVCLVPFTALCPLTVLSTRAVRGYADAHRRRAARVLGEPVSRPYRPAPTHGWLARTRTILGDRSSWRDWVWLFVHSTIGPFRSALSVGLLAGGLFYLSYPLLYWATPRHVFGRPFGFFELHSVAQSCLLLPLALVSFALWYATAGSIVRANARTMRALLAVPPEPLA